MRTVENGYITVIDAAKKMGVTRGDVEYYIRECEVPSEYFRIPITRVRKMKHVHLPSLIERRKQDRRLSDKRQK